MGSDGGYTWDMRLAALTLVVVACGVPKGDAAGTAGTESAAAREAASPPVMTKAPGAGSVVDRPTEANPAATPTMAEGAPPPGIACLREAYGDAIDSVVSEGTHYTVVLKDGARLVWDDGKAKTFEEKLASPDLEDQLSLAYPAGPLSAPPTENDDPGRIRVDAFFRSIYGADRQQVKTRLITVPWLPKRAGKSVRFNRANNAAHQLSMVSAKLDDRLSASLLRYVDKPAGTFNWRTIAGTDRLSAHAFGIAIDINVKHSNYWRWEKPLDLIYKNQIPFDIVDVFEKHGFIWGGKWYHFDTMHFEYRPELLVSGCRRPTTPSS